MKSKWSKTRLLGAALTALLADLVFSSVMAASAVRRGDYAQFAAAPASDDSGQWYEQSQLIGCEGSKTGSGGQRLLIGFARSRITAPPLIKQIDRSSQITALEVKFSTPGSGELRLGRLSPKAEAIGASGEERREITPQAAAADIYGCA